MYVPLQCNRCEDAMRKLLKYSMMLATLCGGFASTPLFSQTGPTFVMPALGSAPASAPTQSATTQSATSQPATSQPATSQPATSQPATKQPATKQPTTTRPATTRTARTANSQTANASPAPIPPASSSPAPGKSAAVSPAPTPPAGKPTAPGTVSPENGDAAKKRAQSDVTPELAACRKRYADAVYNIGLALWTAPDAQRQVLGRLLNAASAVQVAANDPKAAVTDMRLCSDSTLTTLEAAVVRLRAKGWIPLSPGEQQVVHTVNIGDELTAALDEVKQ